LRHEFRVRWYQRAFHEALVGDQYDRAIAVWHRRAGKDEIVLNALRDHSQKRVGTHWHCLPEYAHARKVLWSAINAKTGKRRIDEIFPHEIRETTREQEMFIGFKWGSSFQLIGSDAYDATVGAGPVWISYSEYALANPSAWAYHRPMLEESEGKAAFISTPRGNNHLKSLFDYASKTDRWFAEHLSVHDTGALTQEQLDEALAEYQALYGIDFGRAYFEQEYLCSFSGAMVGAYFGAEMAKAEREGRMRPVPIDPGQPVHTVWDLGKAVNNPIWCFQVNHGQVRIVDFYTPESADLEEWVKWLDGRGYRGNDYVPHDIVVTEWGSKRTRFETLVLLGRKPVRVAKVSVADGLQAGRVAINAAVFHDGDDERGQRMSFGLEGLKAYRREWDDELKTFRENPIKDWAEHIGSAWRYLGLAWQEAKPVVAPEKKPEPVVPKGHVLLTFPGPPKTGGRKEISF
jgi:phage terminase large subunit